MIIDDGLVNRLAHMHARINRDLVDTQRAGPRVTLRRAERKAHGRRAETASHRAGGCPA